MYARLYSLLAADIGSWEPGSMSCCNQKTSTQTVQCLTIHSLPSATG